MEVDWVVVTIVGCLLVPTAVIMGIGSRKLNRQTQALWQKLADEVSGTAGPDGLTGKFNERSVKASIIADSYTLELGASPGGSAWSVEAVAGHWTVRTEDETIQRAGLASIMGRFPTPRVGRVGFQYRPKLTMDDLLTATFTTAWRLWRERGASGAIRYSYTANASFGNIPLDALTQDALTPVKNIVDRYPIPDPETFKIQLALLEEAARATGR